MEKNLSGRAASGGVLAPQPPRATGVGTQSLWISIPLFGPVFLNFFEIGRVPRDFFEKSEIGQ